MHKKNPMRRLLSFLLCLVLVVSCLPVSLIGSAAEDSTVPQALTINKVADPSTKDGWQGYFGTGNNITTDNAGGIWTDKSVFTDASAFSNITTDSQGNAASITMKNPNDFLVALSAMASNMTVSGQASVPTDTMLVLDVSGSMANSDVDDDLADAANTTIAELLGSNPNNRVGVVLYSGPRTQGGNASANDAVVLLPLGRYTTGNDKNYVSYSGSTISLDRDVCIEGTSTRPNTTSKNVVGATYIQKGIILGANQLTAATNETTVNGVTRKPILVLMSDGAPTVSSTRFTNPDDYNLGDGTNSSTSAAQGFVTQLSCAYAKARVEAKYGTDALFYTIGLGTTNNSVATSVLNPAESNSAIDTFWTRYDQAEVSGTVTVESSFWSTKTVTKISTPLEQDYVDKYIPVNADTDLAQGLKDAFAAIVADIQLQSKYFPTLVGDSHNLSGYVSFSDKIGSYMSVKDVKGILLHDQLFSGKQLAENFVEGGGILGTEAEPKAAGTAMMASVRDRLGLGSDEAAISLIHNAYYYGQLAYNAQTGEFSNYIGWYTDAQGNYMGFYQEGVTQLPAEAAYTVKSYGFLGDTDPAHGVSASDMMYATVQVRHNIATGEEEMILKIPAALIPTITYEVELDQSGNLEDLTASGASYPFRLLYEVGLDPHINSLNLNEYVSADYLKTNTNADGSVNFYSNKYEVDNSTGYGKVNTYSYFNPSHQNDKYYFQDNAMVYSDQNGTLYTGSTAPSAYNGTLYRQHISYEKVNGQLVTDVHYHALAPEGRAAAKQSSGANTWYVPEGTVYTNFEGFTYYKGYTSQYDASKNLTGTLTYAKQPFVDVYGHSVDDVNHNFTIGSTLGNNGKLAVVPATGIKLTKEMAEDATPTDAAFSFTLENLTNTADNGTYTTILVDAEGAQTAGTVTFASGKATVQLKAGQTLYIVGLANGTQYKITEAESTDYAAVTNGITVTVAGQQMVAADFVNKDRGTGNLMITKEVAHSQAGHAVPANLLDTIFPITVQLPTSLAGKTVTVNDGTGDVVYNVPANGQLSMDIRHGQTIAIKGLTEGTQVTVTEGAVMDPFAFKQINSRDHSGAELDNDGTVTIGDNANSTVIIHNTYTPAPTDAYLNVQLTKDFQVESSLAMAADFQFALQKWNGTAWENMDVGTVTYQAGENGKKVINLTDIFQNISYTEAGDYAYQIVELIPDNKLPGITYDRTTWTFTVHVVDDGGRLVATVTDDGVNVGDSYNVTFTNTYHTAPVSLDVQKAVVNTAGNPETPLGGFLFQAFEATANWELLDNTADFSVRSDAVGEARFSATYNQAGTHYFVVKEANEQKAGWSYDTTEYHVTVVITEENDGNLVSAMTVEKVTAAGVEAVTGSTITFTNTYAPAKAIVNFDAAVRKELIGRELQEKEFTFAIFPDGKASHTSLREAIVIGNNKADGSVDFETGWAFDKVGTYRYDVVEMTGDLGGITYDSRIYDLVVEVTDNGQGQLAATYYYEDATTQTATFTNTYKATEATYTVTGTKRLTGKALINDEFTFTMTQVADANGTALNGGKTWTTTNAMDGTITFPAITYTQPGTYYYVVSENQVATTGGITFDDSKFIVTVTVTDNGAGKLTASGNVSSEAGISFVNHYTPAKTSGTVSGDKVLEGKVLGAGAYSFQLHSSNANWEDLGALGQPVTNGADGKFQFPAIEYTTAGTYYYLVSEVDGGKTIDGVKYDDSIFRVQVTVTDDLKGQLHAQTVVFDQFDIPQAGVQFVNTYAVVGDASLVLTGSKTLTGKDLTDGEFTFQLFATDGNYTVSGDPIATATNQNGQFTIKLDYTAEKDLGKTYYYVLKEQNAGQLVSGVTYDSNSYPIMVAVADDGVGGIKLTVTTAAAQNAEGKLTTVSGLDFTNTYGVKPVNFAPSGTKVLTGRDLRSGEFTFQLYKANAQFVLDNSHVATVANGADGKFIFPVQSLTTAGTHYFVILESSNNPQSGVTYDSTKYGVTVPVIDNGKGNLTVDVDNVKLVKITANGTEAANAVTFTNSYKPASATVTLSGYKQLTGKALEKDMFTFQLFATDKSFSTEGVDPTQVKNNADGSFRFDTLTFDQVGTYYFVVNELNGGKNLGGITFDDTQYKITVLVTDIGNGQLIPTVAATPANVSVNGGNATVTGLDFTNTYAAAPFRFSFVARKELTGDRQLKAGDFTFAVYAANEQFVLTGEPLATATNKADGSIEFPELEIREAGKHYYVIKEISTTVIPGVTYDKTEYHLTATAIDNGEGRLEVTNMTGVTATGAQVQELVFTNHYDAADTNISLGGKKVLQGKDLVGGEFTFQLQPADEKFQPLAGSQPDHVVNGKDGSFTFDSLTYHTAGTYYYTITEDNTGMDRVTYDETVYHVTVTVEDKGGHLAATAVYTTAEGAQVEQVVFTNVYTPKPEDLPISIQVQKTVKNTGKESIGPEGFTFVLEETEDAKLEATTDADGKVSFDLTATEDMIGETFTLKLYEKNTGKANVTYSDAVYTYSIAIGLSADNKLTATITCNGEAVEGTTHTAQFENVYNYTPPQTPVTGDNMNLHLWFGLLTVSALALAAALIFRKKILK